MNLSDDHIRHLRAIADLPDLSGTKYSVIERIAMGGMGSVYLVEDTELRRKVALKVLSLPDESENLTHRLTREAQIIASLEHPGIVPVHDVGKLPDGRVFYVMKFVQGQDLVSYCKSVTALPDRLRVMQRICEAVAFAHSRGVVHRDLKPANVMIGGFGEVLVMDWGVAKALHQNFDPDKTLTMPAIGDSGRSSDPGDTSPGTIMGTPAYMSPEQASGRIEQVDQRSDIYSLGGILYSMLTGQYPHREGDRPEGALISPRKINRNIPAAVDAICMKAMAPEPSERYQSANQIAEEISRFLDKEPVLAHKENIFERADRFFSRHRFIILLIAAYILVRIILYFLRDI